MDTRQDSLGQVKPPPPPSLNKELFGVWNAWNRMGDREVVRESVAKGLHINLAHTFLQARKGLDYHKIKSLYNSEVCLWVVELLQRQQIFKATHILTNINLDPYEEFIKIFLETCDDYLCDYLANHLINQKKLFPQYHDSWKFLKLVKEHSSVLRDFTKDELQKLTVRYVYAASIEWRSKVATPLYFKIYDETLQPFLKAESTWQYLLDTNSIDILKLWIKVNFANELRFVISDKRFVDLVNLFQLLQISDDMLETVTKEGIVSEKTREAVLNKLCKFGVFVGDERNDLRKILHRFAETQKLDSFYDILNAKNSTVTLYQFYKLLIHYCVKNRLYSVLNGCNIDYSLCSDVIQSYNTKELTFMSYLHTESNFCHEVGMGENILKVAQFLCDDLKSYLEENPLICIAILMFSYPDIDLLELIQSTSIGMYLENFQLTPEFLKTIIKKLPVLNAIIAISRGDVRETVTFYDMLKTHSSLNVDVFKFKLEDGSVPNFNAPSLVERYGYKKKINYKFYLKQGRPSIATTSFHSTQSEDYDDVYRKVYKLIFSSYFDDEIKTSCIAFLEMLGLDSKGARIYTTIIKILLDSDEFNSNDIEDLLYLTFDKPEKVLQVLEMELLKKCTLIEGYSNEKFVGEIKRHKVSIDFAQMHDLALPELFLQLCANQNLWLPFIAYVHIYNYSLAQVQRLVQFFEDATLTEHIFHGLSFDIQASDQNTARDTRSYYLSRIGVRKSLDGADMMNTSSSSFGSSCSSSASSETLDIEHPDFKTDLLKTLIKCHNSIDPPKALLQASSIYKNPIFAVLATSYEPDSLIINWLTWLSVSCNVECKLLQPDNVIINEDTVSNLLKRCMELGYSRTLEEGFKVFLPESPLRFFMEYLNHCIKLNFDDLSIVDKLESFKEYKNKRKTMHVVDVDSDIMFLAEKKWIERTAFSLLARALHDNFLSQYDQCSCLKFLHETKLSEYFSSPLPDFLELYNILNCLLDNECDINLDLSVIENSELLENELKACFSEVVLRKNYKCAFRIAQIRNLPTDCIVIAEWYDKFVDPERSKEFWKDCNEALIKNIEDGAVAVEFFENCARKTAESQEEFVILNLAHKWATTHNLPNLYDIERRMWLVYSNSEPSIVDFDFVKPDFTKLLYTEMLEKVNDLKNNDSYLGPLTKKETILLDKIVNKLLDLEDLWQALRVTKIFSFRNEDMEIIKLCAQLAEGLLLPHQLTTPQRLLLVRKGGQRNLSHNRRRTFKSSRGLASQSSGYHSPGTSPTIIEHEIIPYHDALTILELLSERVQHGTKLAKNILMAYRISLNIERTYKQVLRCENPMILLRQALNEYSMNKLEVVHDFNLLFNWDNDAIGDVLCVELINTITLHILERLEPIILWNLKLDTDFRVILELLVENCSSLGVKLYKHACQLHETLNFEISLFPINEMHLIIELLIKAHDCFTADCNMEGISNILKKCQSIIRVLLELSSWKLIVRLLIGVGRYTEMNYVFHILKENDQFEVLLSKGNRKDSSLKIALLKYLKEYCPEMRETYRMVALHFTLFSEIAELWEEEGRSIIRNLVAIAKLEMQNFGMNLAEETYVRLTNTEGTVLCLQKAIENYTHAAEYHLQGESLAKAMKCAKKAELLALQMSLFKNLETNSTAVCILNASDVQILGVISSELKLFSQVLILVETYEYKADWALVLFEQFVIGNNSKFFVDFLTSFNLSDVIVNDMSKKFISLKHFSESTYNNMKTVVDKCASVLVKYRVASELGFSDVVENLLAGGELAYLKDTVWKRGYKT